MTARFGNPLDLGTGSGVLAIALAKVLRRPVLAADIDPIAVRFARENAALAWAMDRGAALRARISALAEHPNPARRLRFEVYVE